MDNKQRVRAMKELAKVRTLDVQAEREIKGYIEQLEAEVNRLKERINNLTSDDDIPF